jgi:hypothetical protein
VINELRNVWRYVLGWDRAGRDFRVYPDDVFVVSYPRSGNTWTRCLIANMIYQDDPVTFANVEQRIPDIYTSSKRHLKKLPRPRMIKTHEYFDPRYKKVVYIVRDPRDVALSYYHFHIKFRRIEEGYPIDEYIPRFMAAEFDPYGSWAENVASWLITRMDSGNFLLLRYEDMLENPQQELKKAATFLGMQSTLEQLERAITLSSADKMQALERAQGKNWATTKKTRQDKPFVRAARSGEWQSGLSELSVAAIEAAWGPWMNLLGYKLVTRSVGPNQVLEAVLGSPAPRQSA